MGRVVSATEARVRFGELMRQVVESGEPAIVERDGKPQIVVLSLEDYERLRAAADAHDEQRALDGIEHLARRIWQRRPARSLTPAEDVIQRTREERDEQLSHLR